ncbi:MAG: hypothetical protein GX443_13150 [Deltaproteobacteria bacterium]|nr:hypothetical protein [Deltaproteobacteria bacterium]
MKWRKLGRVFCPQNLRPWMISHASNPVADHVEGDLYRVYFSTRDAKNRSSVAWVEVDLRRPCSVERVAAQPILEPGPLGCFDDSGCSMGSIVRRGSQRLLYYMGWNLGLTVPWRNAIGLAVSGDGGENFERVSPAPVMDRSHVDPYTLSYPWVLDEDVGFRMWYGSNLTWGPSPSDMSHRIKSARSKDGHHWERDGKVLIHPENPGEYAFARPSVVKDHDTYRMWYAFRGGAYRIGYAESRDGLNWVRKDHDAGIDVSAEGWDSESIEYPCVFDHGGERYLLYCGNGYGRTGFGIAILESQ